MKFCDEIDKKISLYIDDELDSNSKKEFEQHISLCNECKEKYEEMKTIFELCRDITEEEPPAGLESLIFDRINTENNTLSKINRTMKTYKYLKYISLVAACLCMAVILTGIFTGPMNKKSESQLSSMADKNVNRNSGAAVYDMKGKAETNEAEARTFDVSGSGSSSSKKAEVYSSSQYSLDATENISNNADVSIIVYVSNFEEELNNIKGIIQKDLVKISFSEQITANTATAASSSDNHSLNFEIPKSEVEKLIKVLTDKYNEKLEIVKDTEDNEAERLSVIINLKSK